MKFYRFSPIKTETQLLETIKYLHSACHKLCHQAIGEYLPIAGNVGIFCHYPEEFKYLTKLREQLTESSDNFNQKYFRLHKPITIEAKEDLPAATYTYLYIRQPDPHRAQVGDIDFVLSPQEYEELKKSLRSGKKMVGARLFERADLDMLELFDSDIDALSYVTTDFMSKKVRTRTNAHIGD